MFSLRALAQRHGINRKTAVIWKNRTSAVDLRRVPGSQGRRSCPSRMRRSSAPFADGPTGRYMTHMFDMRCRENDIGRRLTKVRHPWTSGQVERMNRTIKETTVQRYHYDSHQQLEAHLSVFIDATTTRDA